MVAMRWQLNDGIAADPFWNSPQSPAPCVPQAPCCGRAPAAPRAPPLSALRASMVVTKGMKRGIDDNTNADDVKGGSDRSNSVALPLQQPSPTHPRAPPHLHAAISKQLLQPALHKLQHRRPALRRHLQSSSGGRRFTDRQRTAKSHPLAIFVTPCNSMCVLQQYRPRTSMGCTAAAASTAAARSSCASAAISACMVDTMTSALVCQRALELRPRLGAPRGGAPMQAPPCQHLSRHCPAPTLLHSPNYLSTQHPPAACRPRTGEGRTGRPWRWGRTWRRRGPPGSPA